jgi:hypothetical protein
MSRIETATPPPDTLLYEAVDNPSNLPTAVGSSFRRGGRFIDFGVATTNILGSALGAPVRMPLFGRWWEGATSGAGGFGRQSTATAVSSWPVGVDISTTDPVGQFPTRREFTILLYRTPPLLLDVPFGVTLMWESGAQNLLSLAPNTRVGIEVSSRSTVNGGNWTRYLRTVSAAALLSADLGIHPDAGPLHVGWRYEHTAAAPTLSLLMNGAVAESWVGVANLIQPLTFAAGLMRIAVTQNSLVVGQTDAWVQSHLRVDRLPGYPV